MYKSRGHNSESYIFCVMPLFELKILNKTMFPDSRTLVPHTMLLFILQVHLYDGKNLETKCLKYIHEHAEGVLRSEAFKSLCPSCVENIVKGKHCHFMTLFCIYITWKCGKCLFGLVLSRSNINGQNTVNSH